MPGPGWIVTPQGMLDYMREVDRFIEAIHGAVWDDTPTGKIPGAMRLGFLRFLSDWKTFFKEHEGFLDRLSGSVADTTERYETDAVAWRKALAPFLGARAEAIVFDETKKPGGPSLPPIGDVNNTLLIAGAVLGGLWLFARRK